MFNLKLPFARKLKEKSIKSQERKLKAAKQYQWNYIIHSCNHAAKKGLFFARVSINPIFPRKHYSSDMPPTVEGCGVLWEENENRLKQLGYNIKYKLGFITDPSGHRHYRKDYDYYEISWEDKPWKD